MTRGRGRRQAPAQQQPAPRHRVAPLADNPGSGEEFDFTGLDEQPSDEEIQHNAPIAPPRPSSSDSVEPAAGSPIAPPRPSSPDSVEPAAGSAASTRPVTPSEQASERSSSRKAYDIDYFYERGSKVQPVTRTICKTCRYYVAFHRFYIVLMRILLLGRTG